MLSKYQCWRCDRDTLQGTTCTKCHKAYYCNEKCLCDDKYRHSSDCSDMASRYVCSGCGTTKGKMMMCSNCMQAWFCSQKCVNNVFKTQHRTECTRISTSVKELANKIQQYYRERELGGRVGALYYFGNSPAIDLININMNEGQRYKDTLRLLLCGVGDCRNVCLTISKLRPTQNQVEFVLNDISHCTLSRAVLLLYMLCKVSPDQASSVVQVWYSLHLSMSDHLLLVSCLEELVEASSLEEITRGIMKIDDQDQFTKIKEVWKTWLHLSRQEINLNQQRCKVFDSLEAQHGKSFQLKQIPQKHKSSMDEWFKYGVLLASEKRKHAASRENVTLTGSLVYGKKSFTYLIPSDAMPFNGWDYKDVHAAYPSMEDINEMYHNYITDVLKTCCERLQTDQIHISFLLCNCVDIASHIKDEAVKFDRISTSNLWDYISLPRLLTTLKPLLNPCNKSATLLTESLNWEGNFFPWLAFEKIGLSSSRELRDKVYQDTGNHVIAQSYPYSTVGYRDYFSFSHEFTCFTRACLLEVSKVTSKSFIPTLDQIAAEIGIKSRDFVNHGNTISPFRWHMNCRRITMLRGTAAALEWTLKEDQKA